ncbi:hypothetical protein ARZXY2_4340 (plasmid) [Arthrobacter sp. ZXY-2]|nr:hypothetical protein ARZXY2_4340 [Arthrobacter sp. ZXY-2]
MRRAASFTGPALVLQRQRVAVSSGPEPALHHGLHRQLLG